MQCLPLHTLILPTLRLTLPTLLLPLPTLRLPPTILLRLTLLIQITLLMVLHVMERAMKEDMEIMVGMQCLPQLTLTLPTLRLILPTLPLPLTLSLTPTIPLLLPTLLLQLTLLMSPAVPIIFLMSVMERAMEVMEDTGMPQALPREVCWSVDIIPAMFTRTLVMDPLLEED